MSPPTGMSPVEKAKSLYHIKQLEQRWEYKNHRPNTDLFLKVCRELLRRNIYLTPDEWCQVIVPENHPLPYQYLVELYKLEQVTLNPRNDAEKELMKLRVYAYSMLDTASIEENQKPARKQKG